MSPTLPCPRRVLLRSAILVVLPLPLFAQSAQPAASARPSAWSAREVLATETYTKPAAEIERLVTAPRYKNVALTNLSPDRKYFLTTVTADMPTVQQFGKPHTYFAGLQVDTRANRARALTTRGSSGIALVDAATGERRAVQMPAGATASSPKWSPDGKRVAFIANFDDASRLYVADVATGRSRQLSTVPLLATLVTDVDWTVDGKSLVTVLVPSGRGAAPTRPAVETGPLVRLTDGHKDKTRNYASLLRDPYDKAGLEYYATGQLALVDATSGAVKRVGAPAPIFSVEASPTGSHFIVTTMNKPYSYIVQYGAFGQTTAIWDAAGTTVAELSRRPLRESDGGGDDAGPPGAARAGADTARRDFTWLPNGTLAFLQQEPAAGGRPSTDSTASAGAATGATGDAPVNVAPANGAQAGRGGMGGPGGAATRRRDRLVAWAPPFDASSRKVLFESDTRMSGVLFNADASMAFVAENANGVGTVYATYFNEPGKRYTLWRMRGQTASVGGGRGGFGGGRGGGGDDSLSFYQNPGALVTQPGRVGTPAALVSSDGSTAYLAGTRYDREWQKAAPRGFVDRVEIKTGKKTPVFMSSTELYETVSAPLDDDYTKFVVMREGPKTIADAWLRDTKTGQTTQLTHNVDYTPEFTALQRRRIAVTRPDGYRFYVNVTLPANYQAGTRLPGMFWFYPYEYTDQASYDRTLRTQNINAFPNAGPRTIEYFATQGYTVANFDPPIVGTTGRMNDNYISDLTADLLAVIDELDKQGLIDRARLGIGGH